MTDTVLAGIFSAVWLGILTSISPCPLASNIAAISFIANKISNIRSVIISGVLYSLGRSLTYIIVGTIITFGLFSIPGISNFLQKYMHILIGPILIITGIILLDIIKIKFAFSPDNNKAGQLAEKGGYFGVFILGALFALAFCPVSAAFFFGGVIPLSIKFKLPFLFPLFYGIASGLPVMFFAFILAFSASSLGKIYNKLSVIEYWTRRITAIIIILAGVYYIIKGIEI